MGDDSEQGFTHEPQDRLTRLCDAMTETLEAHPEYQEGDKAIMFLNDEKRGGLVMHGYEDHTDAVVDLFIHLKAIFKANGQELIIAPMPAGRG